MRASMTTSPPPEASTTLSPEQEALSAVAARLQGELEGVENGELRAMYLHDLGQVLERLGDDPGAARCYKESYNSWPGFREPLEALIAVFRRRGTYKNLGRLLEELAKYSEEEDSPEAQARTSREIARARVELAAHLRDHQGDAGAARAMLQEATAESPEELVAWLELEALAARDGDVPLRRDALRERAARAESPLWRALLLLDLAELSAAEDQEAAAALCREAAALDGPGRFRAQLTLERLALQHQNHDLLAEALEAQAELIERAIEEGASPEQEGVPEHLRGAEYAADLLLRAAEARRHQGNIQGALKLLERARARAPGAIELSAAKLALADAAGDLQVGAEEARLLLATLKEGPEAAALWVRVARAAQAQGEHDAALQALTEASKADPSSVAARTLLLDALTGRRGQGDGAILASTLELAAEQLSDDSAKARVYLRAAWEWAIEAKDTAAAKTALSLAGSLGAPPQLIARYARLLASLSGDTAWYDESSRRMLQAGASEVEQASVWTELAALRALRNDAEGLHLALDALTRAPGGAWLGRTLAAYLRPLLAETPSSLQTPEALDALAQIDQPPAVLRGLALAAVLRAHQRGDAAETHRRLEALLEADAGDTVAARFLAGIKRHQGDLEGAARVLETAAAASEGDELPVALALESALLFWKAGQRARALEPLRAAHGRAPELAAPLLAWAVRGVAPDDLAERRRVLEMASEEERPAAALERFGLELAAGEQDDARAALEAVEAEGQGITRLAAAMARIAWPAVQAERGQLDQTLSLLAMEGDEGATLSAVERVRLARDVDQSQPDYARQAAIWAEVDPSLPAGFEWLAAAMAAEDMEAEIAAHRLLARHLEGPARVAEEAAATTLQWLSTGGLLPELLPSTEPAAQVLNLELAPAGSDPRRRSAALKSVGGSLGEAASVDARALAGWSDLAAGNAQDALKAFQEVLERRPDDFCSLEGLRTAALQIGDNDIRANATIKLADLVSDPVRSAALFEEGGLLLLDQLHREAEGEQALGAAFAQDPRRFVSFDRLFRRVRDRKQDDLLLDLAQRRLTVTEDETEIVKLYWEQARVFHKRGQLDDALEALSSVVMFEPDNLGAQVLYGDIYMKQNNWEEAAGSFARMSANPTAPGLQRQQAAIQAVTIYEKRLNDIPKAIQVLSRLNKEGLLNMPLRERLAVLATRGESWSEATSMFEALMLERENAEGRIEAARLAMAIWRDKVQTPKEAKRAVVRLLEESPAHPEALRLVLSTDFGSSLKEHALGTGRSTLVHQLQRGALDPDAVALLGEVAGGLNDRGLVQASLGALVALGRGTGAILEQLTELDARAARVPQITIDAQVLAALGDPGDAGPVTRLLEALGETIAEALGPSKDALNVGRKERVDARSGLPLRNDIAAWVGAMGLGEFELYVGGRDPLGIQGVGGEIPSLVVGPNVKSPLTPEARQAIAREVFALKRGTTVVRTRDEATIASIVVAACNLAGLRLESPPFAILGDVQRQLDKAISRKVRKLLPELCQPVVASNLDVRAWAKASQRSLDRMAAIACGDVSIVLADVLSSPRNDLRRQISNNERAERLLRFVLSPQFLELRNRLGMGAR